MRFSENVDAYKFLFDQIVFKVYVSGVVAIHFEEYSRELHAVTLNYK